MATIADELNAISVEHGYTGAAPKTIAGAIDALADTLAGTDVEGKRTIAGAVKALAPYIGSGGGGAELGAGYELTMDGGFVHNSTVYASDKPMTLGAQGPEGAKLSFGSSNTQSMPAGLYVLVPIGGITDNPTVTGTDATFTQLDDLVVVQFQMPENEVAIDGGK